MNCPYVTGCDEFPTCNHMSAYLHELWTRHDRLSDGMDALSRVSGLDPAAQRAAHETLADARAIVMQQISEESSR